MDGLCQPNDVTGLERRCESSGMFHVGRDRCAGDRRPACGRLGDRESESFRGAGAYHHLARPVERSEVLIVQVADKDY